MAKPVLSDDLLRPDEVGFSFDRFYIYNFRNGELQPNPQGCEIDQRRAALTIANFKLNQGGRPAARKRAIDQFRDMDPDRRHRHLVTMPFRYVLIHELDT